MSAQRKAELLDLYVADLNQATLSDKLTKANVVAALQVLRHAQFCDNLSVQQMSLTMQALMSFVKIAQTHLVRSKKLSRELQRISDRLARCFVQVPENEKPATFE